MAPAAARWVPISHGCRPRTCLFNQSITLIAPSITHNTVTSRVSSALSGSVEIDEMFGSYQVQACHTTNQRLSSSRQWHDTLWLHQRALDNAVVHELWHPLVNHYHCDRRGIPLSEPTRGCLQSAIDLATECSIEYKGCSSNARCSQQHGLQRS